MVAPPQIISLPVFGVVVGGIDWPGLGVLAAWVLSIVSIVGIASWLRRSVGGAPATPRRSGCKSPLPWTPASTAAPSNMVPPVGSSGRPCVSWR